MSTLVLQQLCSRGGASCRRMPSARNIVHRVSALIRAARVGPGDAHNIRALYPPSRGPEVRANAKGSQSSCNDSSVRCQSQHTRSQEESGPSSTGKATARGLMCMCRCVRLVQMHTTV